jgi:hypothetical protein
LKQTAAAPAPAGTDPGAYLGDSKKNENVNISFYYRPNK